MGLCMKKEVLEKLSRQILSGKVVYVIMVEETIQSIRETERKADETVKAAEEKGREITEIAKEHALSSAEEIVKNARERAAEVSERAKEAGERAEAEALAKIEKEVESLKTSALEREREVVDLVISLLV